MTQGRPLKKIVLFSLPILFGNLFQMFYSTADSIIVGKTVGAYALAAVGAVAYIHWFFSGFGAGLGAGLTVITAQRCGAGDEEGIRKSFAVGLLINAACSLVLTLLSAPFFYQLLELMQTPSEIIDGAYEYGVILCWGLTPIFFYNFLACILRALGDSKSPLYVLIIACLINIVLDFIFVLWFRMGVAGAALATIISQGVSALLCLLMLLRKHRSIFPRKEDWHFPLRWVTTHLKIGIPMGFQLSLIAIGTIIMQIATNRLGADAIAAFSAAIKINDSLANIPLSFGTAMATYVAQNYGAGKWDRIQMGVRQCFFLLLGTCVAIGILMITCGESLLLLFLSPEETAIIKMGMQFLWVAALLYPCLGFIYLYRNALQGVGCSTTVTISGFLELVSRSIPAIILPPILGFMGIVLTATIAWLVAAIQLTISYYVLIPKIKKNLS